MFAQAAPQCGSEKSVRSSSERNISACDSRGTKEFKAFRADHVIRTNLRIRAREAASKAGSRPASSISSGLIIRRRIVSAMPPTARPRIRPETTTRASVECRMRASTRRRASQKARSSPNATAGIPPARLYASAVTAMLAPECSLWRGQGSNASGSSRALISSNKAAYAHSRASSSCSFDGIRAASTGSISMRPATASTPFRSSARFASIQLG